MLGSVGHDGHDFTPRVFISHSSGDNAFGFALVDKLRAALGGQATAWYDSLGSPGAEGEWEGGIPPATYWQDEIVRELTTRDVFVVILTPRAMQSKWVHDEIALAWSQKNSADVTRGKVIVPVLREKCKVPPLVALVQYVDFRPEVDQEEALAVLLYAIRLGQTRPAPPIELGPPFDLGLLPSLERFVGRAADVQRVMDLLTGASGSDGQIANVAAANGLGGIGKTALATEVVRRLMAKTTFPDGIAVVICKGLTDPVEILRSVLARFTPDRRFPDDDTIPILADRARQLLGGHHALVVLDNVEQGWPVREVVQPLRAAGAAVLLTSRAVLPAVPLEASVKLGVLPLDEALDVFAEYYGRGQALNLTRPEVTSASDIVGALGRHTLAVKLAAANAAMLERPLEAVARELEQNPRRALLLENSDEAVRFVLKSSYEALSPGAQQLFVALAAFATSDIGRKATLSLSPAVALHREGSESRQAVEAEMERALREIVALRLADVAVDERIPAEADRERLRLHPLVRTYAEEHLEKWAEEPRERAHMAVAAYYAGYVSTAPEPSLAADEANILGSVEWAHAQREDRLLAQLCDGMAHFWRDTGRTHTALRYLPWGVEAAELMAATTHERADRRQAAGIAMYYGDVLKTIGRIGKAEAIYLRSLNVFPELGDRSGEGAALNQLGLMEWQMRRLAEAQELFEQSLVIARETGDRRGEGDTLTNLGQVAFQRGQLADARQLVEEGVAIAREVANQFGEAAALSNLGQVVLLQGELEEAQRYFEESLTIRREIGDRRGEGVTLSWLGQIAGYRGRIEEAQRYFELGLSIAREVNDRIEEGRMLGNLGGVALRRGELEKAQGYFEESLAIHREVGNRPGEGVMLGNLGGIALRRGQLPEAQQLYGQSLAIAREVGNRSGEGVALANLGRIAQAQGRLEGAQCLFEDARIIAREVGDRTGEGAMLNYLGGIARQLGRLDEARDLYKDSLAVRREVGDRSGEAETLSNLGLIAWQQGRLDEAQDLYEQSLRIARENGYAGLEAITALALALIRDDRQKGSGV